MLEVQLANVNGQLSGLHRLVHMRCAGKGLGSMEVRAVQDGEHRQLCHIRMRMSSHAAELRDVTKARDAAEMALERIIDELDVFETERKQPRDYENEMLRRQFGLPSPESQGGHPPLIPVTVASIPLAPPPLLNNSLGTGRRVSVAAPPMSAGASREAPNLDSGAVSQSSKPLEWRPFLR